MYLTWSAMNNSANINCKPQILHSDGKGFDSQALVGLAIWFGCVLYSSIRTSTNSQVAKITMSERILMKDTPSGKLIWLLNCLIGSEPTLLFDSSKQCITPEHFTGGSASALTQYAEGELNTLELFRENFFIWFSFVCPSFSCFLVLSYDLLILFLLIVCCLAFSDKVKAKVWIVERATTSARSGITRRKASPTAGPSFMWCLRWPPFTWWWLWPTGISLTRKAVIWLRIRPRCGLRSSRAGAALDFMSGPWWHPSFCPTVTLVRLYVVWSMAFFNLPASPKPFTFTKTWSTLLCEHMKTTNV